MDIFKALLYIVFGVTIGFFAGDKYGVNCEIQRNADTADGSVNIKGPALVIPIPGADNKKPVTPEYEPKKLLEAEDLFDFSPLTESDTLNLQANSELIRPIIE